MRTASAWTAAVAAAAVLVVLARARGTVAAYLSRTLSARLCGDGAGVHDALTADWHTLLLTLTVPAVLLTAAALLLLRPTGR